jgi:YesN/AraC family two-component response regulator
MTKLLIIDDEESIRKVFKRFLVAEGYEVRVAEDGVEGIEIFREMRPDVVITDIVMPNKEGLETIGEMKKINPDARILAISGGGYNPAEIYLRNAQLLGADAILMKPFRVQSLIGEIKKLLGE